MYISKIVFNTLSIGSEAGYMIIQRMQVAALALALTWPNTFNYLNCLPSFALCYVQGMSELTLTVYRSTTATKFNSLVQYSSSVEQVTLSTLK
jgi:hypothetical protein